MVNSTFGTLSTYYPYGEPEIPEVYITVTKDKPVKDEVGNIIAYNVEGSIEKRVMPERPGQRDYFVTEDGIRYNIQSVSIETSTKWYFYLSER